MIIVDHYLPYLKKTWGRSDVPLCSNTTHFYNSQKETLRLLVGLKSLTKRYVKHITSGIIIAKIGKDRNLHSHDTSFLSTGDTTQKTASLLPPHPSSTTLKANRFSTNRLLRNRLAKYIVVALVIIICAGGMRGVAFPKTLWFINCVSDEAIFIVDYILISNTNGNSVFRTILRWSVLTVTRSLLRHTEKRIV